MRRHLSTLTALATLLSASSGLAIAATDSATRTAIDAGDRAWAHRAEGAQDDRAAPGPIAEAVSAYEEALAVDPGSLEAMWKLERALYFQGEVTGLPAPEREAVWDRGVELADRSIAILQDDPAWQDHDPKEVAAAALRATASDRPLAAAVHFWAAIHWGLWGETKGPLAAVRKGVATRIRDHAQAAIALDETLEAGGPHRLLGRLHAVAPRVPLFTGWVSHDEALRHLERAVEIAPGDLTNRLYLAEARLLIQPERYDEALREIEAVIAADPDPQHVVEDRRTQTAARAALESARHQRQ